MSTRIGTLPEIPELVGASTGQGLSVDKSSYNFDGKPHHKFRVKNRLRRWNVTFGNPVLGTYAGSIVTSHPRSRRRQRLLLGDKYASDSDSDDEEYDDDDSSESSEDSFSSCSSVESILLNNENNSIELDGNRTNRIAVMVGVPPHQVPDGVLNLIRSHRPSIFQVRIVIGASRVEEAEHRRQKREMKAAKANGGNQGSNIRRSRSQTWAHETDVLGLADDYPTLSAASQDKNDRNMEINRARSTSLDITAQYQFDKGQHDGRSCDIDNTTGAEEEKCSSNDHDDSERDDKNYHILFVLDSEDSAETFVSDLHQRPFTSLDEYETCSVYPACEVEGEDGVSLLGPFFASSATSPNDNLPPSSAKDEHQCPVCLETLATTSSDESSSILTTVCNHSFVSRPYIFVVSCSSLCA